MSSKRRKEKSYSIHGMQSILSAFISRHQFPVKPYDSYVTNRACTDCLFRCLEQFGYVKKKKTHNEKFAYIKVHLYCKSRLVTINGVLDYIIKSIQYKQFPQCTQYKQFPQKKKKKKKKMEMEEKVADFKKKKEGEGRQGRKT